MLGAERAIPTVFVKNPQNVKRDCIMEKFRYTISFLFGKIKVRKLTPKIRF